MLWVSLAPGPLAHSVCDALPALSNRSGRGFKDVNSLISQILKHLSSSTKVEGFRMSMVRLHRQAGNLGLSRNARV